MTENLISESRSTSPRKAATLFLVVVLSSTIYAQTPTPAEKGSPVANGNAEVAEVPARPALPPWPTLAVPISNSVDDMVRFIEEVRKLQPTTPERYREMQTWIREASKRILEMTPDRKSDLGRTAEFDYISSSVMLMGNEGPDSQRKTFERFRDYLKSKTVPDANDLKMVLLAGQNLEQLADGKTAAAAYKSFAEILRAKKNSELQVWIEMLDSNAQRVELPGKEFKVTGKTVTGEDFDIESCRGKFTLVYFWSSWCKPCREEYPYMKRLYTENKDKGFEIVAISMDEEREKLDAFLKELEVPWINLWDEENRSAPVAVKQYGISSVPTMILLDREGKVVSLEARGLILGRLLEKLFAQPTSPATK